MINDAAMQALGSYAGRTMLFLGLGTGLGNTLVIEWRASSRWSWRTSRIADGKTLRGHDRRGGAEADGQAEVAAARPIDRRAARRGDQRGLHGPRRGQRALLDELPPEHAARQQRERVPRRLPALGRRSDEGEAREEIVAALPEVRLGLQPREHGGNEAAEAPLLITRTTSPGSRAIDARAARGRRRRGDASASMPCAPQRVDDLADVELLVERHLVVRLGHPDRRERRAVERAARTRSGGCCAGSCSSAARTPPTAAGRDSAGGSRRSSRAPPSDGARSRRSRGRRPPRRGSPAGASRRRTTRSRRGCRRR